MPIRLRYPFVVLLALTACGAPPSEPTRTAEATAAPTDTPAVSPTAAPPTPTIPTVTVAPVATPEPLTDSSDPEVIRLRMVNSHTTWSTLWGEASMVEYPPEGSDYLARLSRVQIWVQQPAQALILRGPSDGEPDYLWVTDGFRYLEAELVSGEWVTEQGEIPEYVRAPFSAPQVLSDTITPYPLSMAIPLPIRDMFFPTGLGQRPGTYHPVGLDIVAGRTSVIVDFTPAPVATIADRFRVDASTGLLLRWQLLGKTGGGETVQSDAVFTSIVYDLPLTPEVFEVAVPEVLEFLAPPVP